MDTSFLRGTGVALVTPFYHDLSIDFESLARLINHVINGSADYLVVMGTTGESVVLSEIEKDLVLKEVIKVSKNRIPIVLGIGGNNTKLVTDSIKQQDFAGVSALLSVSPYYNKPNQSGLYAHFSEVAKASPIPIILYNVPGRTGTYIEAETTLSLAKEFDNIVAIKEASGQFDGIMEIIRKKEDSFMVISGDDGLTLPLLSIGVEGVISVIANSMPYEMSEIVRKALNNQYDVAREIHYKLLPLISLIFREGNPAGLKAALHFQGICENQIRLPLTPVSKQLYADISLFLSEI
ncbi:MAG: 4-hydroxy-tetrahydrodipicolinate synthase [Bacteroidales bacterium]|nr:4-hydroxy-tetrahydrodipicolinate synthase [Bacteroidales bacterium]